MYNPAFQPLAPGDPLLIGGYRVLARMEASGRGWVYLATTDGGMRLAVWVVRPEALQDPGFRDRFRKDMSAARRVTGPRVAPIVDFHADAPQPWVATEYVEGPSLAQVVVQQGPLPARAVRILMAGLAESLRAIHAVGVVHGRLMPSSVLLAHDGPRVTGYGVAPAGSVDADILALGGVVFYAATGRQFEGAGLEQCPPDLRNLIERCLADVPADRPSPEQILTTLNQDPHALDPGWLTPEIVDRLLADPEDVPAEVVPPEPQSDKPTRMDLPLQTGETSLPTEQSTKPTRTDIPVQEAVTPLSAEDPGHTGVSLHKHEPTPDDAAHDEDALPPGAETARDPEPLTPPDQAALSDLPPPASEPEPSGRDAEPTGEDTARPLEPRGDEADADAEAVPDDPPPPVSEPGHREPEAAPPVGEEDPVPPEADPAPPVRAAAPEGGPDQRGPGVAPPAPAGWGGAPEGTGPQWAPTGPPTILPPEPVMGPPMPPPSGAVASRQSDRVLLGLFAAAGIGVVLLIAALAFLLV